MCAGGHNAFISSFVFNSRNLSLVPNETLKVWVTMLGKKLQRCFPLPSNILIF